MIGLAHPARRLYWLAALMLILLFAACSGDGAGNTNFPTVATLGKGDVSPVIFNSSLAVGQNRLSLGLMDNDQQPILNAEVRLAFYDLNGAQPRLALETDARFVSMDLFFVDEDSGGDKQFVGSNGVYVASVTFSTPGRWGVLIEAMIGGKEHEPIPFQFNVLQRNTEVMAGDQAPPSRQSVLADVSDISEIDSSYPSRPQMHDITIADALQSGKPLVVSFATPAFCESRTCGPVMDVVMDPLFERYKGQAAFIHVEPYQLKELREGIGQIPVPAAGEWGIQSEPWVFVIDGSGKVSAKFEGIMGLDEVEAALIKALAATP